MKNNVLQNPLIASDIDNAYVRLYFLRNKFKYHTVWLPYRNFIQIVIFPSSCHLNWEGNNLSLKTLC